MNSKEGEIIKVEDQIWISRFSIGFYVISASIFLTVGSYVFVEEDGTYTFWWGLAVAGFYWLASGALALFQRIATGAEIRKDIAQLSLQHKLSVLCLFCALATGVWFSVTEYERQNAYSALHSAVASGSDEEIVQAVDRIVTAARTKTERINLYINIGRYYAEGQETDQAIGYLERALPLTDDGSFYIPLVHGLMEYARGNATSSLEQMKSARDIDPDSVVVNYSLASIYIQFLDTHPHLYNAHSMLAHARLAFNRGPKSDITYREMYGAALSLNAQYDDAINILEEAGVPLNELGQLYLAGSYIEREAAKNLDEINLENIRIGLNHLRALEVLGGEIPEEMRLQMQQLDSQVAALQVLYPENDFDPNVMTDDERNERIESLLQQYEAAPDDTTKALVSYLIAQTYDNLEERELAARYYRISANHYPTGGSDYYDALAQAEWSLRNGAKVKEYYEQGLARNPDAELLIYQYGYFLLGISMTSLDFIDLQKALLYNQRVVELSDDDANLQNLYLNLIMLDRLEEAGIIRDRFADFETADNYHWIARAYHRIGNRTESAYYLSLAEAAGYTLDENDQQFFQTEFR